MILLQARWLDRGRPSLVLVKLRSEQPTPPTP